jgi:hypothetical protein
MTFSFSSMNPSPIGISAEGGVGIHLYAARGQNFATDGVHPSGRSP